MLGSVSTIRSNGKSCYTELHSHQFDLQRSQCYSVPQTYVSKQKEAVIYSLIKNDYAAAAICSYFTIEQKIPFSTSDDVLVGYSFDTLSFFSAGPCCNRCVCVCVQGERVWWILQICSARYRVDCRCSAPLPSTKSPSPRWKEDCPLQSAWTPPYSVAYCAGQNQCTQGTNLTCTPEINKGSSHLLQWLLM